MKARWALLALLLAACGQSDDKSAPATGSVGAELDRIAIEKGLIPDPASLTFEGRYETHSELGTDKFCALAEGDGRYRVGFLSVYGTESKCEAQGTAEQDGERISISLSGAQGCSFDAEFDGIVLRFPGMVPESCAALCSRNASMSGTRYYLVDTGEAAAKRAIGRDFERLCG